MLVVWAVERPNRTIKIVFKSPYPPFFFFFFLGFNWVIFFFISFRGILWFGFGVEFWFLGLGVGFLGWF